jgi:hypothetical protein
VGSQEPSYTTNGKAWILEEPVTVEQRRREFERKVEHAKQQYHSQS